MSLDYYPANKTATHTYWADFSKFCRNIATGSRNRAIHERDSKIALEFSPMIDEVIGRLKTRRVDLDARAENPVAMIRLL